MTPEEQQAIMAPHQAYTAKTLELYRQRFAVQTVGIVQELKAKGMDVSGIEEQAQYGYRLPELITSLRAMAGRLDAQDRVRR